MPPPVKGEQNVTPSIIKEALFQIIENRAFHIEESAFFDLFSGSGQIALEALSCGFRNIHLVEIDNIRFRCLVQEVTRNNYAIRLHRKDFRRMIPLIIEHKSSILFMDPPYSFWKKGGDSLVIVDFIHSLMDAYKKLSLNQDPATGQNRLLIFVQGPEALSLPVSLAEMIMYDSRNYRGNFLTIIQSVI